MLVAAPKSTVPPLAVTGILLNNWACSILFTAIDLELFEPIKDGVSTPSALAQKLKLNEKGVAVILDALVGVQLLEKSGNNYKLTDAAALYLVKSSPLYLGDFFEFGRSQGAEAWKSLTESVRTGKPGQEVNKEEKAQEFFPILAAGLFPMNYATASMVVDHLHLDKLPKSARVLDVAAGSAVWSIPMAEQHSTLTVDALDFPPILKVAERFAKKCGVHDRFKYLSGNWRDVTLQPDTYDVVVLGHILHSEGRAASKELLGKISKAMKSGGRIIVAEFIPNETRTGPLFPLLFAVNMYLVTTEGCTFSLPELTELLGSQGFEKINRLELPFYKGESPVVVATKK